MKAAEKQSRKQVAFAALRQRDFRFFFAGTMLAMMADNIEHVVSYWLLFQKFHSPVLAGFADISHWTPFLLLSVYFGSIADRYDCRKVIQVAQVMYMGVSVAWAILFYTDTIQVWHASILLIIHGIAGVLWTPAEQLFIHDIVGTEQIQSAVRLNATSRQLGILFGPAVGAGLMFLLGPVVGTARQRCHLFAIDGLAAFCAVHGTSPRGCTAKACAVLERRLQRDPGGRSQPADHYDGDFGRQRVTIHRQRRSHPDARIRP